MNQKHYSNEDITITWTPGLCQHSTFCWKGLLEVFDPRKKPWINMQGTTTDRIIDQVKKCPSGALQFNQNESPGNSKTSSTDPPSEPA